MGRIRSVKPEILEDEKAAGLTHQAWRLWVSMWLLADDHGRLRGAPEWLHAQVFWKNAADVPPALNELAELGLIRRYHVNGQQYIEISNWSKHQKVDHPSAPRIPTPPLREGLDEPREDVAKPLDTLAPDPDLDPEEDQDPDQEHPRPSLSFDFEAVYAKYPRKLGRKKGQQRFKSQITTREKYDALAKAVANYAAAMEGSDEKYVKHFDTFMSCWEDYIEAVPALRIAKRPGGFTVPMSAAARTEDVKL